MSSTSLRPALGLLSLLAASLLASPAASQAQSVFVEPTQRVAVQETERVTGSLRARSTSKMAALEEGVLLELTVREADHVKRGDVLARLDTRRLEAARIQMVADRAMAEATRLERKAQLENAELDLEALTKAADSGAVSDRDLRSARLGVSTGKALVEAARQSLASFDAALELVDIRIADGVVRAPFDAQVVARHAEVGQWTRPGDPLVTLVSAGALEAWLELPERFIGRFDGSAATLELVIEASGRQVTGVRPRAIPTVDERARTYRLVLDVPAAAVTKGGLRPGMSISGSVPLGKLTEHLVVPKDAVLRRGESSLVATVGEDGIAQLAPVRVLFAEGAGFAVEPLVPGGLAEGVLVVVEGNERLFPGTPVTPVRREEAAQGEGQGGAPDGTDEPQRPESQPESDQG
ncbi:MAG: efflux RND transporter periplasmic adaptor subunit [Planctomycetota bacterium]|nr:efflux RND transporter periplasmic adaptor subunit [Planctomycetota bacterium]